VSNHNVFEAQVKWDGEDPEGHRSRVADISTALGITDLSVRIFEVPPGQSVCPYH